MDDPTSDRGINGSDPRCTAEIEEADETVQREFSALTEFLANLRDQESMPRLPSITTTLDPGGLDEIVQWSVVLHGVQRLTEVAALRAHLLQVPRCISARVIDLSSREIRLLLTATKRLEQALLEEHVANGLRQHGSAATFAVLPAASPAG